MEPKSVLHALWDCESIRQVWHSDFGDLHNADNHRDSFMACLDVKKRRGSRVEGRRVVQLPYLGVF